LSAQGSATLQPCANSVSIVVVETQELCSIPVLLCIS